MKKHIKNSLLIIMFTALSTPAFAEAGAREDNSMTLVYLFLGTCGLIILLQLIPVFTMVYGIIKGVFGKKEEKENKPAPAKYH
jgi:TctA family transporter